MSPNRFRLESLTASGFRGIADTLTFEFHPRANLFLAPNGCGKTSILGAIEWALFGQLGYQPHENKTSDELVNITHYPRQASVEVVLRSDRDTLRVIRTKREGKMATSLRVIRSEVREFEDEAAEAECFRRLGLTFEDFSRAVFLHQESIRGLLTDEPRVRNDAFDRLFGVNKLRDILKVLSPKAATDAIDKLEKSKRLAFAKIEGASDEVRRQRERARDEATREGLSESELTLEEATEITAAISTALQVGDTTFSGTAHGLGVPAGYAELDGIARSARERIREIRSRATEAQLRDKTGLDMAVLDRLQANLATAARVFEAAKAENLASQATIGQSAGIAAAMEEARARLTQVDLQVEALGARQRVVADAVRYLSAAPDVVECPVCGQSVAGQTLLAHLNESVEQSVRIEVERLQLEREVLNQTVGASGNALSRAQRLEQSETSAGAALSEAQRQAQHAIGATSTGDDLVAALGVQTLALEASSTRLLQDRAAAEANLQMADAKIDRLRLIYRYLKASAEVGETDARRGELSTDESETDQQLEALAELREAVELVGRAVQTVAGSRAREAVTQSRELISSYYSQLCKHPYFDGIVIGVEDQRLGGLERNNYLLRTTASSDGAQTLASSRLSTAQMNCVALSVYLALASGLQHNLGFVILDDPSQSLDSAHKQALADLLQQLDPMLQVVVATQDVELGEVLEDAWKVSNYRRYGLSWSSRTGTRLSEDDG